MDDYKNIFGVNMQNAVGNPAYMFKGTKYRITIITDRLVRFEYSENGSFEDRKKAARWCSLTGNHYLHGSGTPQDTAEAIRWYKLAEEMGGEDSAMKLAVIYHYGIGIDRDLAEARRWYEKAAKNGDSAAAYALTLPEFRDSEADNG